MFVILFWPNCESFSCYLFRCVRRVTVSLDSDTINMTIIFWGTVPLSLWALQIGSFLLICPQVHWFFLSSPFQYCHYKKLLKSQLLNLFSSTISIWLFELVLRSLPITYLSAFEIPVLKPCERMPTPYHWSALIIFCNGCGILVGGFFTCRIILDFILSTFKQY